MRVYNCHGHPSETIALNKSCGLRKEVQTYLNMGVECPVGEYLIFYFDLDHIDFAARNDNTIEVLFIRCSMLGTEIFFVRKR